MTSWDAEARERGLSLCKLTFAVRKGKLSLHWTPVAVISLHALGRWFERSRLREHEALIAAVAVLVDTDETIDRVPTSSSGGFWLGAVVEGLNDHDGKGDVRTWLAS
jgi:hypothetical protein